MTPQEKTQLTQTLAMYAAYYRVRLEDEVLALYAEDLSDLDSAAVKKALDEYRKNPKNRAMPLPAMIREVVSPRVDFDSAAREVAARITHAITKFGWCNGQHARAYIGEIGWSVIERQGGWSHICQNHGISIDPGAFQAQVRELAKSTLTHDQTSMAEMIGLPGAKHGMANEIRSFIGGLVKTIEGSKS